MNSYLALLQFVLCIWASTYLLSTSVFALPIRYLGGRLATTFKVLLYCPLCQAFWFGPAVFWLLGYAIDFHTFALGALLGVSAALVAKALKLFNPSSWEDESFAISGDTTNASEEEISHE